MDTIAIVGYIPFEVLARAGGGRATDTFHLVDLPLDASGSFTSRFFVSGLRYTPDIDAVLATIHDGARLRLELEETDAQNPKAVLMNTEDGQMASGRGGWKLGYVPDWLCGEVHARLTDAWELTAVAERVNPSAPACGGAVLARRSGGVSDVGHAGAGLGLNSESVQRSRSVHRGRQCALCGRQLAATDLSKQMRS